MHNFVSFIILALIFISTFLLASSLSTRKQSTLVKMAQKGKRWNEKKEKEITSSGIISKYFVSNVLKDAVKYEYKYSKESYWLTVLIAGTGIASFVYYIFNQQPILLFTFLFGFTIPRLLVYRRKKKHYMILVDRLSVYMKSVASALGVSNNITKVLEDVKPLMHSGIQEEIDKVISSLQTGTRVNRAFQSFNEKFYFKEVVFFHEMLDIFHREGSKDAVQTLLDLSRDFENQKVLVARLRSGLAQAKRAFFQNALIVIAMPVLMMIMSPEAKKYLSENIIGQTAIALNLVVLFFLSIQVEKIANFNPMERKS